MTELTDDYIMSSFLQETKKRSDNSFNNMMVVLGSFFRYVKKPLKDMTILDVRDYFINDLDKRNIKLVSKNVKRYMLVGFFDYVRRLYLAENIDYQNPVPSTAVYQFTQLDVDVKRASQVDLKVLSLEELDKILFWVQENKPLRDLVMLLLIMFSGARISEIRTILREDIHADDCFFETGFIKNARKSTLNRQQGLLFFFPKEIVPILRKYVQSLDTITKWLFPGYSDNHVSTSTAGWICGDIRNNTNIMFSWHWFRSTIITERKKMNCPLDISEMLMNHSPSSVEAGHYIRLSVPEKFAYYMEYFPYTDLKFLSSISS